MLDEPEMARPGGAIEGTWTVVNKDVSKIEAI